MICCSISISSVCGSTVRCIDIQTHSSGSWPLAHLTHSQARTHTHSQAITHALWIPKEGADASDQAPSFLVVLQVEGPPGGAVLHRQCVWTDRQRLGLCRTHTVEHIVDHMHNQLPLLGTKNKPGESSPALGTCRSIFTSKSWTLNKSSERSVVGLGTSFSLAFVWEKKQQQKNPHNNQTDA